MSILTAPWFHDEDAAVAKLESIVWPNGVVCPHCGVVGEAYELKGKRARPGLRRCKACRKDFTARVGTIFESSHVALHLWLQAFHLMASSKKGISAHQIHRVLEVTYKTAWFMAHRIREAMRSGGLAVPMGGDGGAVEADETFIGNDKTQQKRRGYQHKLKVLTLVERNTRQARSFHVDAVDAKTLAPMVRENLKREARLMTDEANYYTKVGREFADHGVVSHKEGQYVDGDKHTNTAEGFFSIFKRGMKGVYQHCSAKHLHRYLAEFDFRYNHRVALGVNDTERALKALLGTKGKRLMYRDSLRVA